MRRRITLAIQVSKRLPYATSIHSLILRANSINGAKILFKIIGPGAIPAPDLNMYSRYRRCFRPASDIIASRTVCSGRTFVGD